MLHPFIGDLSEKSIEVLQGTITSLSSKLNYAYRTGNSPLIHQLTMVLENYKEAYAKKIDELVKKQNIESKINIEKK